MISSNSQMQRDIGMFLVPQKSINSISSVLSRNMLGVIIEFINLRTQFRLNRVNKKFRQVLQNSKIFTDFIKERKESSRITNLNQIFCNYESSDLPYIIRLRNELKEKYPPRKAEDFFNEIMKIILNKMNFKNELDLAKLVGDFPETIELVLKALKENTNITSLYLEDNNLGNRWGFIEFLIKGLKENTNITTLYLAGNYLGNSPEDLNVLIKGLKDTNITTLDLGRNYLGWHQMFIYIIIVRLKENSKITTLFFADNDLGSHPESMDILIAGLSHIKSISTFYLYGNNLARYPERMKMLIKELKACKITCTLNPELSDHATYLKKELRRISRINDNRNSI